MMSGDDQRGDDIKSTLRAQLRREGVERRGGGDFLLLFVKLLVAGVGSKRLFLPSARRNPAHHLCELPYGSHSPTDKAPGTCLTASKSVEFLRLLISRSRHTRTASAFR